MSEPSSTSSDPRVLLRTDGGWLRVELQGAWRITERRPLWAGLLAGADPAQVKLVWGRLEDWDSA
ncbi:MAG TPA: hypothetical protein VIM44_07070, partial [Rariglobus sp.]